MHAGLANDVARAIELTASSSGQWHQGGAARPPIHELFQYPAMMVPSLQREFMTHLTAALGKATIFDPFVGSGTVMTEAMKLGHTFVGVDINPLAILICQAKLLRSNHRLLMSSLQRILTTAVADRSRRIEATFPGRDKWFQRNVSEGLSKLVRAIREEPAETRPLWWVTLSHTARVSSNTRTSTFKLHQRPAAEIRRRNVSPIPHFRASATRNVEAIIQQANELSAAGWRNRLGRYGPGATIILGDTRWSPWPSGRWATALVTSPPYGDNSSTVTYGQAAYLPLQWVDLQDIGATCDSLATTHQIDADSLGGSLRDSARRVEPLRPSSPSLDTTLDRLGLLVQNDRFRRVAAFCSDLESALAAAIDPLVPNAPIIMTLGDRSVGGIRIPMVDIVNELLASLGATHLATIRRDIPTFRKRMPLRNNVSATMREEATLILRAPGSRRQDDRAARTGQTTSADSKSASS